jgi:carbon monoxide dehydrogenase subunit G
MASRIEERFAVKAPLERVWVYLVDPRRVVTCLPGAELTEVVDDRNFLGKVKVKVGPVAVAYQGRVRLVEVDEAGRRVRLTGEGRESGGTGSAKMSMESTLAALPGGLTEVVVRAEVDIAGRLVQLGRGMIEQVSHQLFGQFSECVRASLEAETAPGVASAAPSTAAPPLRAIPLVLRAFFATVAAFLRKLFGGRKG